MRVSGLFFFSLFLLHHHTYHLSPILNGGFFSVCSFNGNGAPLFSYFAYYFLAGIFFLPLPPTATKGVSVGEMCVCACVCALSFRLGSWARDGSNPFPVTPFTPSLSYSPLTLLLSHSLALSRRTALCVNRTKRKKMEKRGAKREERDRECVCV